MRTLLFDIKTVGEDWEALDLMTQTSLTSWIGKTIKTAVEQAACLAAVKSGLGLSPLSGTIVSLAVHDLERAKGAVYYVGGGVETDETVGLQVFKQRSEITLLQEFWEGARDYDMFVTFNGRRFDIPFLLHRSVAHSIRPSRELLTYRYLTHQSPPYHVDLLDQLTFYGAMPRQPNLYLFCRAYGIALPNIPTVLDLSTHEQFHTQPFRQLAQSHIADIVALTELYKKWLTQLAPANFLQTVDL